MYFNVFGMHDELTCCLSLRKKAYKEAADESHGDYRHHDRHFSQSKTFALTRRVLYTSDVTCTYRDTDQMQGQKWGQQHVKRGQESQECRTLCLRSMSKPHIVQSDRRLVHVLNNNNNHTHPNVSSSFAYLF